MEEEKKLITTIEKFRTQVEERKAKLRLEIRKVVLGNYLLQCGWSPGQIRELHKSIKINFWCGIGYSKAVSTMLQLTKEKKAVIWTLVERYSACKSDLGKYKRKN